MSQNLKLYVTSVKPDGDYIKFHALLDAAMQDIKKLEQFVNDRIQNGFLGKVNTRFELLAYFSRGIPPICIVDSKNRKKWCRGKVENVEVGQQSVAVTLVDYGDFEVVPISDVRLADAQIAQVRPLATECILADVMPPRGASEWPLDAVEFCEKNLIGKTFSGNRVTDYDKIPVLRIAKTGEVQPFVQELINKGYADVYKYQVDSQPKPSQYATVPQTTANSYSMLQFKRLSLEVNTMHLVSVSHVMSSHIFFVQLSAAELELNNLMEAIETHFLQQPQLALGVPAVGMACIAVLEKRTWRYYRGVVSNIKQSLCEVMLIDFGEVVAIRNPRELCALPLQFFNLPAQAIKCSLRDRSQLDVETFKKLICRYKYFNCQVVALLTDTYVVMLSHEGRDLLSLVEVDLTKACYSERPLPIGVSLKVNVSFFQDPFNFYCQLSDHKNAIEALGSVLLHAEVFEKPNINELFVGSPVCAKYAEDELWYRSKVVAITQQDVEVFFVDYGNSERVSFNDVRTMTANLLEYPMLAYRFSLHDIPQTDDALSDSVIRWFENMTEDKCLTAEIKSSNRGIYSVILYDDGEQSINKLLLRTLSKASGTYPTVSGTEKVFVMHTSPNSFFGQLSKFDQELLTNMQEDLNQFYVNKSVENNSVSAGDLVCAKFSEDQQFYRALVESVSDAGCYVFFVDYGNRELVPFRDVHQMHQKFCSHPYFGVECVLKTDLGGKSIDQINELISENELELVMERELGPGKYEVTVTPNFDGNAEFWNAVKQSSKMNNRGNVKTADSPWINDNQPAVDVNTNGFNKQNMFQKDSAKNFHQNDTYARRSPAFERIQESKEPEDYGEIVVPNQCLTEVFVSYVKSPSEFYCQLASGNSELLDIMDEISKVYGNLKPDERKLFKARGGMPCCAMYEEDSKWYRGRILSVKPDSYQVLFVDYGNVEIVPASKVKTLQSSFLKLSPQALKCGFFNNVPNSGQWNENDIKAFFEMACERSFIAQFVKTTSDGSCLVSLFPVDKLGKDSLNERFVQLGHGHLQDSSKVLVVNSLVASTGMEFNNLEVKLGETEDVEVTFWHTSRNVSCQLKSQKNLFTKMMEDIQKYYNSTAAKDCLVDRPIIGMNCVALFNLDQLWYRAKVNDIKQNNVTVYYVDYGNEENVSKKDIRYIVQEFTSLPIQAIQCCMPSVRDSSIVPSPECSYLFEGTMQCTFLSKEDTVYIVKLSKEGKDLATELLKFHGLVEEEPTEIPKIEPFNISSFQKSQLINVAISFIENPSRFWCQVTDKTELSDIMDLIKDYATANPQPAKNLCSGSSCIAKYSEDDCWYRATVIGSSGVDQKEVMFVDYGNVEIVNQSEIIEIKKEFLNLPAQAFQCCLFRVPKTFSEESNMKFQELVENSEEVTAKIEKISNGIAYVTLLVETEPEVEVNIVETLFGPDLESNEGEISEFLPIEIPSVSEIHNATIAYSVNPGNFHIHLAVIKSELEEFTDLIMEKYASSGEALEEIVPGSACCAKFSDDDAWYRAQITDVKGDEITVYFVDYGNYDTVTKSSLKQIDVEDLRKPPYAIPAFLQNASPVGNEWSDEAIDVLNSLIEEPLMVRFLQSSIPVPVSIMKGEEAILQMLEDKGLVKHVTISASQQDLVGHPPADAGCASEKIETVYPTRNIETDRFQAIMSHTNSCKEFFIVPEELEDELHALSDALCKAYDAEITENETCLKPGRACVAKYSEDGFWYRATIIGVTGEDVSVMFVDYGNEDTINSSDVKRMTPDFLVQPPFAIKCKMVNLKPKDGKDIELNNKLQELIDTETVLSVEVCRRSEVPVPVRIISVENNLVEENLAEYSETPDAITVSSEVVVKTLPNDDFLYSRNFETKKVQAKILHVETHEEFFITAAEWEEQVLEFGEYLNQEYEKDKENETSLRIGKLCVAKYSEDEAWYRAVITKIEEQITVMFIDYGNTDTIDMSNIKVLEPEFCTHPPFAVKCTMNLKSINGKEEELKIKMQELVESQTTLEVEIVDNKIPLNVKIQDFSDQLVHEGLATYCTELEPSDDTTSTTPESMETNECTSYPVRFFETKIIKAKLCHVNSSSEFFLTAVDWEDDLYAMSESLGEVYSSDTANIEPECLLPGLPCAAKYSADETWYRAVITKVEGTQVSVLFVDYGNEDTVEVSDVKTLKNNFLVHPHFAVKCTMHNLQLVEGREPDMLEKLKELVDAESCLDVEIIDSSTATVSVTIADVAESLVHEGIVDVLLSPENEESSSVSDVVTSSTDASDGHQEVSTANRFSFPERQLLRNSKLSVSLTHVKSWKCFYVTCADWREDYKSLENFFNELDKDNFALENMQVGSPCCFRDEGDGAWYRANIAEVNGNNIAVCCADTGKEHTVNLERIKELPQELSQYPIFAVECTLYQPASENKEQQISDWLSKMLDAQNEFIIEVMDEGRVYPVKILQLCDSILIDDSAAEHKEEVDEEFIDAKESDEGFEPAESVVREIDDKNQVETVQMDSEADDFENNQLDSAESEKVDGEFADVEESYEMDDRLQPIESNNIQDEKQIESVPVDAQVDDFENKGLNSAGCEKIDGEIADDKELYESDNRLQPIESDIIHDKKQIELESVPVDTQAEDFENQPECTTSYSETNIEDGSNDVLQEDAQDFQMSEDEFFSLANQEIGSSSTDSIAKYASREVKSIFCGRITSIHSCNKFFVTSSEWSKDESCIEETLQTVDKSEPLKFDEVFEKMPCISKVGDSYHRVLVERVQDSNISLLAVDDGHLFKLKAGDSLFKAQCLEIPPLAIECHLPESLCSVDEQHVIVEELESLRDSKMEIQINLVNSDPPYIVRLMNNGVDVLEKILENASKETDHLHDPEVFKDNLQIAFVDDQLSLEYSFPLQTLPPSGEIIGELKHVMIDQLRLVVYIVPSELEDLLAEQQAELQNQYCDLKRLLPVIREGMCCVVRFPEDNFWYRAIIVQCSGNSFLVKSVDYGSEEEVSQSDIRELLPAFSESPPFSVECCLSGVSIIKGSEEAVHNEIMKHEGVFKAVLCEIPSHSYKNSRCIKSITASDVEITQTLSRNNLVRHIYPKHQDLTHFEAVADEIVFDDLSCFYLTPSHLLEERKTFQNSLQEYYDGKDSYGCSDVSVNCLYSAKINSDWCRVSIEKWCDDTALVVCVDRGTICEVHFSDMCDLDDRFSHKSPFSIKCHIPGIILPNTHAQEELAALLRHNLLECVITGFDVNKDACKLLVTVDGKNVDSTFVGQADSRSSKIVEAATHISEDEKISNISVEMNETIGAKEPLTQQTSDSSLMADTPSNSESNENIPPFENQSGGDTVIDRFDDNETSDNDNQYHPLTCEQKQDLITEHFCETSEHEDKTARPSPLKDDDTVTILHVEVDQYSNVVFCVVPTGNVCHLENMNSEMQEHCDQENEQEMGENPPVSETCLAKFGGQWKRGIVLDFEGGDKARVLLIDYGHEELIDRKSLKNLPDKFLRPSFSYFCTLPRVKCFEPDSEEKVCNCLLNKIFPINILDRKCCPIEVKLIDEDNIVQKLISENSLVLQLHAHTVSLEKHLVRISSVSCDSKSGLHIYVQLMNQLEDLKMFSDRMQCVYQNNIGALTAEQANDTGLYAIDHKDVWKRCTVLKTEGKEALLFLVDEGECLEAEGLSLEPLLFDFSLPPPFAAPCIISNLPPDFDESLVLDVLRDASKNEMELWATFCRKQDDGFYTIILTGKDVEGDFWQNSK